MAYTLITNDSAELIRKALQVNLTADVLPDAAVLNPLVVDAAQDEVESRDPAWATREGKAQAALIRAAVYFAAAHLAPTMLRIRSEQHGEETTAYDAIDWDKRAAELMALGGAQVARAISVSTAVADTWAPTAFVCGAGLRNR